MKRLAACMLLTCAIMARAEFQTIDIFVDSKDEALAAYQLEFSAKQKTVRIVGVEGGDHEAFKNPPFYDPKAMQRNRVIIGSYSTATELPRGKTRVATIHVQVSGTGAVDYRAKLQTAAKSEGDSIAASATCRERNKE